MSSPSRSFLALALAAVLGAPAQAGEPAYQFIDLGTLGGPHSGALGLNNHRQVVGWSEIPGCVTEAGATCRRAFLWEDGVMTDLGLLPGDEDSQARAINDAGLIVGTSESDIVFGSGIFHGVLWNGGAPAALPDLGDGQSFAQDVNENGLIVGHAVDPSAGADRAVRWQFGQISVIHGEPHTYNRAMGVNDDGVAVGFAWNLFQPNDAILNAGGVWTTIGGIDGPHQNAEARDVNNTGLAVGLQAFPNGDWHPTIWTMNPPGAIDLGTLDGLPLGELFDVNDSGLAVGRVYDPAPPFTSRAVYYDGSRLVDLNDLLPAGTDALLWDATEVNEFGDIVGSALIGGERHAFLLALEPTEDPWVDLGQGKPGVQGVPVLTGEGSLVGGTLASLSVSNGRPGGSMTLVFGASLLNAPFKGGTMVPSVDVFLPSLGLDGAGAATLSVPWQQGLPGGLSFYLQGWSPDPAATFLLSASNGLMGTTP